MGGPRLTTEEFICKENNIILHRIKYDEDKKQSIVELRDRVDNLWN